jgi:hypothetical protein
MEPHNPHPTIPSFTALNNPRQHPVWSEFLARVAADLANKAAAVEETGIPVAGTPPGNRKFRLLDFDFYQHLYCFYYEIEYVVSSAEYRAFKWKVWGSTPLAFHDHLNPRADLRLRAARPRNGEIHDRLRRNRPPRLRRPLDTNEAVD